MIERERETTDTPEPCECHLAAERNYFVSYLTVNLIVNLFEILINGKIGR